MRAIGVKDTSKVGVTNLQIDLTNCNDEAPRFVTGDTLYFSVAEKDYSVNTAVTPSNPSSGLKDVQVRILKKKYFNFFVKDSPGLGKDESGNRNINLLTDASESIRSIID